MAQKKGCFYMMKEEKNENKLRKIYHGWELMTQDIHSCRFSPAPPPLSCVNEHYQPWRYPRELWLTAPAASPPLPSGSWDFRAPICSQLHAPLPDAWARRRYLRAFS